jgi:hypothetical protein
MANMARIITSSSEYHSMLAPGVATLLTDAENDMKVMEEETVSLQIDKDKFENFHSKLICFRILLSVPSSNTVDETEYLF